MRHLLLYSGGMDSTALLLRWPAATPVIIDYGQPPGELYAARNILAELQRKPLERGLHFPPDPAPPGTHHAFRPGRNLLFLTLAAAAVPEDAYILVGAVQDDAEGFPDCRAEFFEAAARTLSLALAKEVQIHAPFLGKSKREIVAGLSEVEREIVRRSVSCYHGTGCGACDACRKRAASSL